LVNVRPCREERALISGQGSDWRRAVRRRRWWVCCVVGVRRGRPPAQRRDGRARHGRTVRGSACRACRVFARVSWWTYRNPIDDEADHRNLAEAGTWSGQGVRSGSVARVVDQVGDASRLQEHAPPCHPVLTSQLPVSPPWGAVGSRRDEWVGEIVPGSVMAHASEHIVHGPRSRIEATFTPSGRV